MAVTYKYRTKVYVAIYAKSGGIWTKIASVPANVSYSYSTGGTRTLNWYLAQAVQLGSGIQAFGAGIDFSEADGSTANLTTFSNVSWVSTSGSGVRSATPAGQTTTATVRPQ